MKKCVASTFTKLFLVFPTYEPVSNQKSGKTPLDLQIHIIVVLDIYKYLITHWLLSLQVLVNAKTASASEIVSISISQYVIVYSSITSCANVLRFYLF